MDEVVTETDRRFDIIISDSTDPIDRAKRCLRKTSTRVVIVSIRVNLATQNGVAFMQPEEVAQTAGRLDIAFADWHFLQRLFQPMSVVK